MPNTYLMAERVSVDPTITIGAYAANDVVGGLLTFNIPSAGGTGIIESLLIADSSNVKADVTLHLFNVLPTAFADNAVFAPVIADLQALVYVKQASAASYITKNSLAYSLQASLNAAYYAPSNTLWGYLVTAATPTYTAVNNLRITLTVITS